MKILFKTLLVSAFMTSIMAFAAQPSPQDTNLMGASLKVAETYKQTGVSGVFNEMRQCYAGLKQKQPLTDKDVEFCVALDMSALILDYQVSQANGFPRDSRFMDDLASNRMHGMLMNTNISKSVSDTKDYLGARHERVQRYTTQAMTLVANSSSTASKSDNTDACMSTKMAAWDKKRDSEVRKWCGDLAKKGKECRISTGVEEDSRNDALQKIKGECVKVSR